MGSECVSSWAEAAEMAELDAHGRASSSDALARMGLTKPATTNRLFTHFCTHPLAEMWLSLSLQHHRALRNTQIPFQDPPSAVDSLKMAFLSVLPISAPGEGSLGPGQPLPSPPEQAAVAFSFLGL